MGSPGGLLVVLKGTQTHVTICTQAQQGWPRCWLLPCLQAGRNPFPNTLGSAQGWPWTQVEIAPGWGSILASENHPNRGSKLLVPGLLHCHKYGNYTCKHPRHAPEKLVTALTIRSRLTDTWKLYTSPSYEENGFSSPVLLHGAGINAPFTCRHQFWPRQLRVHAPHVPAMPALTFGVYATPPHRVTLIR